MKLLAVFTAAPESRVYAGRQEIGSVETGVLTGEVDGPRVPLLGGRSWKVTHIDWNRRQVFVENTDIQVRAKWMSLPDGASFEVTRGAREVLLGAEPAGVTLTRRAAATLEDLRLQQADQVTDGAFVIARDARDEWRWRTWAGAKTNRTPQPGHTSSYLPDSESAPNPFGCTRI